jgi:hypothetical protein
MVNDALLDAGCTIMVCRSQGLFFHAFCREAMHQEKDEAYYAPVVVTKMRTFQRERLETSRLLFHLLEVDSSPLRVAVMV